MDHLSLEQPTSKENNAFYDDYDDADDTRSHAQSEEPRFCSIRGCGVALPANYGNKMCETCKGRHRMYAMTKRARRKTEKTVLGDGSAAPSASMASDATGCVQEVSLAHWYSVKLGRRICCAHHTTSFAENSRSLLSQTQVHCNIPSLRYPGTVMHSILYSFTKERLVLQVLSVSPHRAQDSPLALPLLISRIMHLWTSQLDRLHRP